MVEFKQVPLFGGAAGCELPINWVDASNVRQVPDNQEVYLDTESEQSVIIEILEFQAEVSDEKACEFFFADLANADGAESVQLERFSEISEKQILATRAKSMTVEGLQTKGKSGQPAVAVFVAMGVLRLFDLSADILVTLHAETEASASIHRRIFHSITFHDRYLFS